VCRSPGSGNAVFAYESADALGAQLASALTRPERFALSAIAAQSIRGFWSQARAWAGDEGTETERAGRIRSREEVEYKDRGRSRESKEGRGRAEKAGSIPLTLVALPFVTRRVGFIVSNSRPPWQ